MGMLLEAQRLCCSYLPGCHVTRDGSHSFTYGGWGRAGGARTTVWHIFEALQLHSASLTHCIILAFTAL